MGNWEDVNPVVAKLLSDLRTLSYVILLEFKHFSDACDGVVSCVVELR